MACVTVQFYWHESCGHSWLVVWYAVHNFSSSTLLLSFTMKVLHSVRMLMPLMQCLHISLWQSSAHNDLKMLCYHYFCGYQFLCVNVFMLCSIVLISGGYVSLMALAQRPDIFRVNTLHCYSLMQIMWYKYWKCALKLTEYLDLIVLLVSIY